MTGPPSVLHTLGTVDCLCCTNRSMAGLTLFPDGFMPRHCDVNAERGEAVRDGDVDLELGNLTVKGPRHEVLIQPLCTVHFCLDAASAVLAVPPSPECSAGVFRRPQGLVASNCTCAGGCSKAWHSCGVDCWWQHPVRRWHRGTCGCHTPRQQSRWRFPDRKGSG